MEILTIDVITAHHIRTHARILRLDQSRTGAVAVGLENGLGNDGTTTVAFNLGNVVLSVEMTFTLLLLASIAQEPGVADLVDLAVFGDTLLARLVAVLVAHRLTAARILGRLLPPTVFITNEVLVTRTSLFTLSDAILLTSTLVFAIAFVENFAHLKYLITMEASLVGVIDARWEGSHNHHVGVQSVHFEEDEVIRFGQQILKKDVQRVALVRRLHRQVGRLDGIPIELRWILLGHVREHLHIVQFSLQEVRARVI